MSTALDKTIARAEEFLKRFRDNPVAHLIDGKPDAGNGATFETHSPVDNEVIAKVARGGAAEIDKAAKAATKAFCGEPSPTRKCSRRMSRVRIPTGSAMPDAIAAAWISSTRRCGVMSASILAEYSTITCGMASSGCRAAR